MYVINLNNMHFFLVFIQKSMHFVYYTKVDVIFIHFTYRHNASTSCI